MHFIERPGAWDGPIGVGVGAWQGIPCSLCTSTKLLLQMACFKSFAVPAKRTAKKNHVKGDVLVCCAQLHALIARERVALTV